MRRYLCGIMIKNLPDEELLKMIQTDDQDAFSVIMFRYNVRLYKIIQGRIRSEDDAKDILQEIFISLWNNRHHIQLSVSLFPYLSKSAFYAIIDWQIQHKKSLLRHDLLLAENEPSVFPVENQIIADELNQELLKELDRMPLTTRTVFKMSRVDHKSVKEIASLLQLSEQTVRNNISIALQHIRRRMVNNKLTILLIAILLKIFI